LLSTLLFVTMREEERGVSMIIYIATTLVVLLLVLYAHIRLIHEEKPGKLMTAWIVLAAAYLFLVLPASVPIWAFLRWRESHRAHQAA
jgi:hypothetical protein